MGNQNIFFWMAFAICAILFISVIVSYSTLLKTEADQNDKLLGVVYGTSIVTAILTWALVSWKLSSNPNMMIKFLVFFTMMVLMPVSLISAAVSTAHLTGLRDTLAAGSQNA
jgi:hypothetical protein